MRYFESKITKNSIQKTMKSEIWFVVQALFLPKTDISKAISSQKSKNAFANWEISKILFCRSSTIFQKVHFQPKFVITRLFLVYFDKILESRESYFV